ncbi:MAG TPA: glutamine amidotransferase [Gammaproteobacteria bacterium]|nr:glutamine amidotransferase [Gammaproteobacteria bacterium]
MPEQDKPFLIIQLRPEDEVADSEFRAFLRFGGLQEDAVVRARVERTGLPDVNLDDFAAIIVGGSPFDVSIPETRKSAIQQQLEADFMRLLEKIAVADFPFLGACSGSSLLGRFCGAHISGRFAEPVGGADIFLTDAGRNDPLLVDFPASFRVLLGHKEACDATPPGTVLLARSAACPVQMIRLRNNIYATQFHPEGDPEGFAIRIRAYRHHGYFAPETAKELMAAVSSENTPFAKLILHRFVNIYRRRCADPGSDRTGDLAELSSQ